LLKSVPRRIPINLNMIAQKKNNLLKFLFSHVFVVFTYSSNSFRCSKHRNNKIQNVLLQFCSKFHNLSSTKESAWEYRIKLNQPPALFFFYVNNYECKKRPNFTLRALQILLKCVPRLIHININMIARSKNEFVEKKIRMFLWFLLFDQIASAVVSTDIIKSKIVELNVEIRPVCLK
jgi:hypothetical protein